MTETLPVKFRKGGDVNVNYDWVDFTSGAGYKTFYGASGKTTNTSVYFLTNRVCYSVHKEGTAEGYLTSVAAASAFSLNFDMTFNVNAIVAGGSDFIVNATVISTVTPNQFTYKVFHVRGAVETELATFLGFGASTGKYIRECAKMQCTTDTIFAKGDVLRLNVTTTTTNGTRTLYHDPASMVSITSSGVTFPTDLTLQVPFKITT